MTLINFDDYRRSNKIAEIMFIRAFIAAGEPIGKNRELDLEFRINGVDVDFGKFCQSFEKTYDAGVADAAAELLRQDVQANELHTIVKGVTDELRERAVKILVEKFGMTPENAMDRMTSGSW